MLQEVQEQLTNFTTHNDLLQYLKSNGINYVRNNQLGLMILKYDKRNEECNFENPFTRFCRGLVIDMKTRRIVCSPPEKSINFTGLMSNVVENDIPWNQVVAEDFIDGTMINVFNYKNEWHISTRSRIGANCRWLGSKSFSEMFNDAKRKTIGVAACDIDQDGFEEIYFLNTDTYSGEKKYSDRLIDGTSKGFVDLFEKDINKKNLNLTAGRSVVCVDRNGDGKYGIYVANYGGPTRFYELATGQILDLAKQLKIDKITGGRAVVAGNILSGKTDIFAANERGKNFLYYNSDGFFKDIAEDYRVDDQYENGRGTTLSDILYRGRLDIVTSNWNGYHRAFVLQDNKFKDIAAPTYNIPTRVRTIAKRKTNARKKKR